MGTATNTIRMATITRTADAENRTAKTLLTATHHNAGEAGKAIGMKCGTADT